VRGRRLNTAISFIEETLGSDKAVKPTISTAIGLITAA
jgi:hypothetical protein